MKKPIGKIILNSKMIGWTDNLNRISLTMFHPEAIIYEGQNLTLINQACAQGKITFIKYEDK
jgi:hypothetical protein